MIKIVSILNLLLSLLFVFYNSALSTSPSKIIVESFKISDIETNMLFYDAAENVNHWLADSLSSNWNLQIIPGDYSHYSKSSADKNPNKDNIDIQNGPIYVLKGMVFYYDEEIVVNIVMTDISASNLVFEDGVYTYDLSGEKGLKYAVVQLSDRITKRMHGETPDIYRTDKDETDQEPDNINSEGSEKKGFQELSNRFLLQTSGIFIIPGRNWG